MIIIFFSMSGMESRKIILFGLLVLERTQRRITSTLAHKHRYLQYKPPNKSTINNMISKSKQSIIITQSTKPIHLIKQLTLNPPHNKNINYFLITTLDHKIILIEIDHGNVLACRHVVVDIGDIVTAVYEDVGGESGGGVFLGLGDGGVGRVRWGVGQTGIKLLKDGFVYQQPVPSKQKSVIMLYTGENYIYVFNLANQLKIIDKSTMKQLQTYTFSHHITAATYFKNTPESHAIGCVSFNNKQPPIIFNCSTLQKFISTYKQSQKLYYKYQLSENQITNISDTPYRTPSQTYIICSSYNHKQNSNSIIVYWQRHQNNQKYDVDFLEPVYKFDVKGFVLYLSVKDRICMVCLYNSLVFFQVSNRKRVLIIEKSDLQVTIGLMLKGGDQGVKFMVYKGFNFLQPLRWKETQIKLRIRSKNYDESKSK